MATANSRERTSEIQPSEGGIVYTVDQFLHDVQALPALSAELRKEALDGEAYETLVRRITALHLNITEYAERARLLSISGVDFYWNELGLVNATKEG